MATRIVPIASEDHVMYMLQQFPNAVVYFDNIQDSVCQKIKPKLFQHLQLLDTPILVLNMNVCPSNKIPFATVYKDSELHVSLYESDPDKLGAQIRQAFLN